MPFGILHSIKWSQMFKKNLSLIFICILGALECQFLGWFDRLESLFMKEGINPVPGLEEVLDKTPELGIKREILSLW